MQFPVSPHLAQMQLPVSPHVAHMQFVAQMQFPVSPRLAQMQFCTERIKHGTLACTQAGQQAWHTDKACAHDGGGCNDCGGST
eukprot:5367527-Lingulodinium_polyedra.AAC.1